MANKLREGGTYSPLGKTKVSGEDFNCGVGNTKGLHRRSDNHKAAANSRPRSSKTSLRIHGDGMQAGGVGSDGSRKGPRGRRSK